MKAAVLASLLLASTAMAAPGVDLSSGSESMVMSLVDVEEVAAMDITFGYNPEDIVAIYECTNEILCETYTDTIKIFIEAPYTYPVPEISLQTLGAIRYEFLGTKAPEFWIIEEHYFNSEGESIPPKKGKKKWKGKRPKK